MKKRLFSLLLVVLVLAGITVTAFAETHSFTATCTFDSTGKKLEAKYVSPGSRDAVKAALNNMQPGDSMTITITLKNDYTKAVDWYMKNEVVKAFEESGAKGGAYVYKLTYNGTVLYDNTAVGVNGQGNTISEGLANATNALKDYFFLETMKAKGSSKVTLYVECNGETQRNSYQDKVGQLLFDFAVEIHDSGKTVKTGDDTVITPYLYVSTITGILLLAVAIVRVTKRSKKKEAAK